MRSSAFASPVLAIALALASTSWAPKEALADVQHVVARGHTIEAIAHRYHVPVQAILDANHLKDARHLKIGETLTIPGVQPPSTNGASGANGKGAKTVKGPDGKPVKPVTYAMRPKTPDVVHVSRLASGQEYTLHVNARRGKISPTVAKTAEEMMRSMGGLSHPIEPRLVHLLAAVSNHFGSRKVEIISGFRPYSQLQHTTHSNHNVGKAVDFRVLGVPNEAVRDYCRTLRDVGCGYYPNSTFVHMDVRDKSTFWIDYSRPGEPPRYNAPNLDADEGTSDVGEEAHLAPADADESPDPSPSPAFQAPVVAPTATPPSGIGAPTSTPPPSSGSVPPLNPTPATNATPTSNATPTPTPTPNVAPTPNAIPSAVPSPSH